MGGSFSVPPCQPHSLNRKIPEEGCPQLVIFFSLQLDGWGPGLLQARCDGFLFTCLCPPGWYSSGRTWDLSFVGSGAGMKVLFSGPRPKLLKFCCCSLGEFWALMPAAEHVLLLWAMPHCQHGADASGICVFSQSLLLAGEEKPAQQPEGR